MNAQQLLQSPPDIPSSQNHNNLKIQLSNILCQTQICPHARVVSDLLMPDSVFILDANLVAKKHLCAAAFPAAVAGTGEHETACRVDVD